MAVIDPNRTWELLEQRLAVTTDARHRVVLGAVIEHMRAEAAPDLDRLMATLNPAPDYHFWNGGQDVGPKGTEGVRTYYIDFLATRTNILEYELDRLVVDDHCLVDDEAADYLVVFRQLILWPVDEDGLIQGEDSYHSGPSSVTKLSFEELPQEYVDLVHTPAT